MKGEKHPDLAMYTGEVVHYTLIGPKDDLVKIDVFFSAAIDGIDGLDIARLIRMAAPKDSSDLRWLIDLIWGWLPISETSKEFNWQKISGDKSDVYIQATSIGFVQTPTRPAIPLFTLIEIMPTHCYSYSCSYDTSSLLPTPTSVAVAQASMATPTPRPTSTPTPVPRDYSKLPDVDEVKKALTRAGFNFNMPDDSPFSVLRIKGIGRDGSSLMIAHEKRKTTFVMLLTDTSPDISDPNTKFFVILEFIAAFNPNQVEEIGNWISNYLIRMGQAYARGGWYEAEVEKTFNGVVWEVSVTEAMVVELVVSWD